MLFIRTITTAIAATIAGFALSASAGSNTINGTAPAADRSTTPTLIHASRFDISPPIREIIKHMPPEQPRGTEEEPYQIPNILLKLSGISGAPPLADSRYLQRRPTGTPAPAVDLSFEAINVSTSGCGCLPPDTNGDVSDTHYIQWVNTAWQAFDKTTGLPATETPAPVPGNSFWNGFGGHCETENPGDPIALWDPRAARWVMSQFATSSPFAQCVAVSTTSDPFGTYARYEFNWPNFGDYPKMAVWTDTGHSQDAYLLTTHEFSASSSFLGAAFIAMERDKMLTGDPNAAMLRYPGFDAYGVEPVNLVGPNDAPINACPMYVHFDATTSDYLFWDLCLDWTTPGDSTISADPTRVAGAPFSAYGGEVPQQGTAAGLDSFGTHIMYRANARAFGADAPTNISLVVNHAVFADQDQSAINWVHFNLDDHGANPGQPTALDKSIVDQGTYAPDAENRWMGGIAIDGSGDIGVGFSRSSSTSHPQVMITGRTLGDPAGTLRDENNCTDSIGNGSQTSTSNRWGDYSSMSVDPVDQCTFYFTNEYYPTTSSSSWHTRVCTFKFDDCGSPTFAIVATSAERIEQCEATTTVDPTYSLRIGVLNGFSGSVTLSASGLPSGVTAQFSPATVTAPGTTTLTLVGGATVANGDYTITINASSGSITRSTTVELASSDTAPPQVQLATPGDTTTGTSVLPTLTWSSGGIDDRIFGDNFDGTALPPATSPSNALSYTVEVASDSAFSNIVASATVTTTSWTVDTPLAATTQYYWRVTPHNLCGDGPVSATFSFTTGDPSTCPSGTTSTTVFDDDLENGVNGWVAAGTGGTGWTQGAAQAGTGLSTTVWRVPDNTVSSDRTLTSPSITIPSGAQSVILTYDAYHNSEQDPPQGCWDSSSLETSTDGTTFSYLDGSHLLTDPYNGTVTAGAPLAGRKVWCYPTTTAQQHAIVALDEFAGQSIKLRYHMASDSNTAATAPNGIAIDNVKVQACQ